MGKKLRGPLDQIELKPGNIHIAVTIPEYVCSCTQKEDFKAINKLIAGISCERSILLIITAI